MNLLLLSWRYVRAKWLLTALSGLLTALGVATITVLALFNHHLETTFLRDARGIDLVVGAKGSPLQLILCNVFHVDLPTGNIPLAEADKLARNRLVKQAIPLSLGDNFVGYRIVGTTPAYASHYAARPAQGRLWQKPMEATLGADVARATGIRLGDTFASGHGLSAAGEQHAHQLYRVVGIFAPTQSVLDRLVLTDLASVWEVHSNHEADADAKPDHADAATGKPHYPAEDAHQPSADSAGTDLAAAPVDGRQITALLIRYRSPMGAVVLPRLVNAQSALQAASPAFELAKLLALLGIGLDTGRAFAGMFILMAAMSVFVVLYNTLRERAYDLAVMRTLGASPARLFTLILLQGTWLVGVGTAVGILLGHGALAVLQRAAASTGQPAVPAWTFIAAEGWLMGAGLLLGAVAALLPAVGAYRLDISRVLARA